MLWFPPNLTHLCPVLHWSRPADAGNRDGHQEALFPHYCSLCGNHPADSKSSWILLLSSLPEHKIPPLCMFHAVALNHSEYCSSAHPSLIFDDNSHVPRTIKTGTNKLLHSVEKSQTHFYAVQNQGRAVTCYYAMQDSCSVSTHSGIDLINRHPCDAPKPIGTCATSMSPAHHRGNPPSDQSLSG
jgi:hypothetical protein